MIRLVIKINLLTISVLNKSNTQIIRHFFADRILIALICTNTMRNPRNTDELKTWNVLSKWRKIFYVFFVLFIQQLSAQVTIIEGTKVSVDSETIIYNADAQSVITTTSSKGEIFIVGDARIYQLNSENSFEIVTNKNPKNLVATKTAQPKAPRKAIEKQEPAKPKIAHKSLKSEPSESYRLYFSRIINFKCERNLHLCKP